MQKLHDGGVPSSKELETLTGIETCVLRASGIKGDRSKELETLTGIETPDYYLK